MFIFFYNEKNVYNIYQELSNSYHIFCLTIIRNINIFLVKLILYFIKRKIKIYIIIFIYLFS